jgi:hypothetical protein
MDKNPALFFVQASHNKMVLNQSGFSSDPWGVKKVLSVFLKLHLGGMLHNEGAAKSSIAAGSSQCSIGLEPCAVGESSLYAPWKILYQ